MTGTFLLLASPCYGGLAQAAYMRAVLELRAACAKADISLQLDLGGGEALLARGLAGMLARFLSTAATHILFAGGDSDFDVTSVMSHLAADAPVVRLSGGGLLVRRDAAQQLVDRHPELQAGLGDVRHGLGERATMLFDAAIDPAFRSYLAELDAFLVRLGA